MNPTARGRSAAARARRGDWARAALAVVAFVGVAHAPRAAQAAWTQAPGDYYLKVASRVIVGDSGLLADGTRIPLEAEFIDAQLSLYGEFGVRPWLTVIGQAQPFGFATIGGAETTYLGPFGVGVRAGDSLFGVVRAALEIRYAYAPGFGQTTLWRGVHVGEDGVAERWVYNPTDEGHLIDADLLLGYGLPAGCWLSAAAGMRHGTARAYGEVFTGRGQFGWQSWFGLVTELHTQWHLPLEPLARTNVSGAGPTRYVGIGLSVSYWLLDELAFFVGLDGALLAQANAAAPVILAGFEHRHRGVAADQDSTPAAPSGAAPADSAAE